MSTMTRVSIALVVAAALLATAAQSNARQALDTRIGRIDTELGVPTKAAAKKLFDEMDFQRACQAYLWALPTVGFEYLRRGQSGALGAADTDVVIYKGHRDVSGILTPNVTTPYIVGFSDLSKTGPLVLEVPAGTIAGSAMDFWQRALTDFGITGPDQGRGGRFLLVGPGQDVPADLPKEIVVVRSPTFGIGYFYRAIEDDPAKAAALERGIKVYPWSGRDGAAPTRHITPSAATTATLPRGLDYWRHVAAVIDREPVVDRDRFFVAMLRPLGIERGKPFEPDARQRRILEEAARVGELMAQANSFDKRFAGSRYREGTQWDYVIMADPAQDLPTHSQLDERAAYFYEAVALSKAMVSKTPGQGQAYLGSYRDRNGRAFDGGRSYRLRVPADAPAQQFWSVTVYDTSTRSVVQNPQRIADRSSRQKDLRVNADGSVDIHFGPKAPKGFEQNWIPTVPGRAWFTYLRLYAPLQPYFDRRWPLPDIEPLGR